MHTSFGIRLFWRHPSVFYTQKMGALYRGWLFYVILGFSLAIFYLLIFSSLLASSIAFGEEAIPIKGRGESGKNKDWAGDTQDKSEGLIQSEVKKLSSAPFNGGVITDITSSGDGSVFLIAHMPEGYSIYKFNSDENSYTKFISSGYLEKVLPSGINPNEVFIKANREGNLLALLALNPPILLLLDFSEWPKLKRFQVKLPPAFVPGKVVFLGAAKIVVSSRGFSAKVINYPLLLIDIAKAQVKPIKLNAPFAVIRDFIAVGDDKLIVVGYFKPFSAISSLEIGEFSIESGDLELWREFNPQRVASKNGRIALISQLEGIDSTPEGDSAVSVYELLLLTKDGNRYPGSLKVSIYGKPGWLGLCDAPFKVLLISEDSERNLSLWIIDTSLREKILVARDVNKVEVISEEKIVVLPRGENQLDIYWISP